MGAQSTLPLGSSPGCAETREWTETRKPLVHLRLGTQRDPGVGADLRRVLVLLREEAGKYRAGVLKKDPSSSLKACIFKRGCPVAPKSILNQWPDVERS